MRHRVALATWLFVAACIPFAPGSCGRSVPVGQFGAYAPPFKQLRLHDGEEFTVYRVKRWTYSEDGGTALQLEFQTAVPVSDTAALREQARRVWEVFGGYVEQAGVMQGVVTATDLDVSGPGGRGSAVIRGFGVIAERDSAGRWHDRATKVVLPPIRSLPPGVGIFEADGQAFRLSPPR